MKAPDSPGTFRTQWMVKHGTTAFGPNMYIDVTAGSSLPANLPDLRIVSGPELSPSAATVNQMVDGNFVVHNFGGGQASLRVLGLGGRGPAGESDVEDFPWANGIVIGPGQDYAFSASQTFSRDGQYRFFPVYQTWSGDWVEIRDGDGNQMSRYLLISATVTSRLKSLQTTYNGLSREVVDIRYTNVRENPDGSLTANIWLVNKKDLALAVYFYNFGKRIADPSGITDKPYIILMPTGDNYYQGLSVRDVTFWPDSHFHINFTAWGGGGEDSRRLFLANMITFVFIGVTLEERLPVNTLDFNEWLITSEADIWANVFPKLSWAKLGYDLGKGDWFSVFHDATGLIRDNADKFVPLAARWIPGLTGTALKNFLSAPLHIILSYFRLWPFAADVGGSKWWGTTEVDILPSTQPISAAANVVGEDRASGIEPAQDATLADGYVPGNQVVASSSEYGPGWEYYKLIDGSYATGWGNGINLTDSSEWVTMQLAGGKPVTLSQVIIHPGPVGNDPASLALKAFRVESSLDGVNFAPLLESEFSTTEVGAPKSFTVEARVALYIQFLAVSNQNGDTSGVLSVAELSVIGQVGIPGDSNEPNDHPSKAKWISFGTVTAHTFSYPGDLDWMMFNAQAGSSYTIRTLGLGPNTDTILELFDQDGATMITNSDDSNGTLASRIDWIAPVAGTYYVKVRQFDGTRYGVDVLYTLALSVNPTPAWYAEFYDNENLAGDPIVVGQDAEINFEWHSDAPAPGVPADHFSSAVEAHIEPCGRMVYLQCLP